MDDLITDGQRVRVTMLVPAGRTRACASRGRVCGHAECGTVLSIYNSATNCWVHQAVPIPRTPSHELAERGALSLREEHVLTW